MVRQASPWCSHPGFPSSWLHIILAPWWKASKFPRHGIPEGWSLCLLKLVPRILIQTCCSSISYRLFRISTDRSNVKRMVGQIRILHCYDSQLYAYISFGFLSHGLVLVSVIKKTLLLACENLHPTLSSQSQLWVKRRIRNTLERLDSFTSKGKEKAIKVNTKEEKITRVGRMIPAQRRSKTPECQA